MDAYTISNKIDQLSQQALAQINQADFGLCQILLDQRFECITALTALYPEHISQESLLGQLNQIKSFDFTLIRILEQQKADMQNTFANFNHLKEYLKL